MSSMSLKENMDREGEEHQGSGSCWADEYEKQD